MATCTSVADYGLCGRDLNLIPNRHARRICLAWQLLIFSTVEHPAPSSPRLVVVVAAFIDFASVFGQMSALNVAALRLPPTWLELFGLQFPK